MRSTQRLFKQPDGKLVCAYLSNGGVKSLSVVTVSKSANGTTYTSERGLNPRSAEYGQLYKAVRAAMKSETQPA